MVDEDLGPESTREVSAEDFLFHLYRGSELLQDDRVHEAKQELENALSLQPRDPKGQDLLAIVYFRLGLYPRAISIYSELIQGYPDATTPRINLALCYLKTGQPGAARVELERVIQRDPNHSRAWGYLGLAFQRLGDAERAIAAFQAGGQHSMAKRLLQVAQANAEQQATSARALTTPEREVVSRVSTEVFDELERSEGPSFVADRSGPARLSSSGPWAAVEPGREVVPSYERKSLFPIPASADSLPPPPLSTGASRPAEPKADVAHKPDTTAPAAEGDVRGPATDLPERQTGGPRWQGSSVPIPPMGRAPFIGVSCAPPPTVQGFAREHLFVFPRDHAVSLHPSGCVLVQSPRGVAVRFDTIRAMSGATNVATRPLMKRGRGREAEEPLGNPGAPLLSLEGVAQLVLGPPAGTKLVPIALSDEVLTMRESTLVALEGDVVYENARLAGGDGDFVSMVHLRGSGTATLALPTQAATVEVVEGRTVLVRVHAILGWLGRVNARALAPSESPTRARGLVAVQGEGTVVLDGR